jgi:hypothetical protein
MKQKRYKFKYGANQFDTIESKGYKSIDHAETEIGILYDMGYEYFSNIVAYEENVPDMVKFDVEKITRITVVGPDGREFEKRLDNCKIDVQDDGQTLKIFYED